MLFLETFKNRDLTLSGRNDALNPCHLACSSVNNWVIRLKVSIYTLLSSLPFQGLTLANIGLELTVISPRLCLLNIGIPGMHHHSWCCFVLLLHDRLDVYSDPSCDECSILQSRSSCYECLQIEGLVFANSSLSRLFNLMWFLAPEMISFSWAVSRPGLVSIQTLRRFNNQGSGWLILPNFSHLVNILFFFGQHSLLSS